LGRSAVKGRDKEEGRRQKEEGRRKKEEGGRGKAAVFAIHAFAFTREKSAM
jgi:hypothetical protein